MVNFRILIILQSFGIHPTYDFKNYHKKWPFQNLDIKFGIFRKNLENLGKSLKNLEKWLQLNWEFFDTKIEKNVQFRKKSRSCHWRENHKV